MKKVFLLGFFFILLLAIPFTIYFVKNQTQTKTQATQATTLYFNPDSATVNVGQPVNLDIMVNPTGGNQITLVKLAITYDATKLSASDGSLTIAPLIPPEGKGSATSPTEFQFLAGPTYSSGLITATLASPNPSSAIQTSQKIATISFNAIAATNNNGIQVAFDIDQTSARSNNCDITNPSSCKDQPTENVLQSAKSAIVVIQESTAAPTSTPAPTTSSNASGPTCTGINASAQNDAVNFTVTGIATPGATISKVTLNFGDGEVKDITDSGGIGTNAVNVQTSHTYLQGTFTANAILTDSNGATSSSSSCSQIITINGESSTNNPAPTTEQSTPIPTIAQTGSQTVFLSGAIGIVLLIVGSVLLFGL